MARRTESNVVSTPLMALHLLALFSLVVAKPLFDVLAANPEFLVVNRIRPGDLYLFVFVVALGIPLLLAFPLTLVKTAARRMVVQSILVSGLVATLFLQFVARAPALPAIAGLLIALAAGVGVGLAYHHKRQLAQVLTFLSPLIVLFPVLFVFDTSIQRVLRPDQEPPASGSPGGATWVENRRPIVMVVFDELALVDLLDAEGRVDAARFPNLARFAAGSTWYRHATTVWHATTWAVPAILTGRWPQSHAFPRVEDYPQNLFTLLEPHYTLHVEEPTTDLLPRTAGLVMGSAESARQRLARLRRFGEDMGVIYLHQTLPPRLGEKLPPIEAQWGGFVRRETAAETAPSAAPTMTRDQRQALQKEQDRAFARHLNSDRKLAFESFIAALGDHPASTVHFIHSLLPHRPWRYLPSGAVYTRAKGVVGVSEGKEKKAWIGAESQVERLHHAHLLQTAFVDTLIGALLRELERLGLYDDSLVILTADHGISFQYQVSNRRPYPENYGEIAFVPLFIKYPGQREGVVDRSNVETIDILPTIVDVLGAKVDWELDGRSLLDGDAPERPKKRLPTTYGEVLDYSEEEYLAALEEALARNTARFSLDDPGADPFHPATGRELLGRPLSELTEDVLPWSFDSAALAELRRDEGDGSFVPAHVAGSIDTAGGEPAEAYVAATVDGVVRAVGRPYEHDDQVLFDLVLPEAAVRPGANDVRLVALRLRPTPPAPR